jgi:hypothetical protein
VNPGAVDSTFRGVSCATAPFCVAVGYEAQTDSTLGTLIERWDGAAWTVMSSPRPSSVDSLSGVSCSSVTSCVAVGETEPSPTLLTLVESWDGTAWTVVASPSPTGSSSLQSVSCVSPDSCVAVGSSVAGSLTELWDGATWTIARAPRALRDSQGFTSVSCWRENGCFATALFRPSGSVIARWNGRKWSVTPGGNGDLWGVSCTGERWCVAAGAQPGGALIDTWNGSTWSIGSGANPGFVDPLHAVTCMSPKQCVAVGYGDKPDPRGTNYRTLVELWNGSDWRVNTTPNPRGVRNIVLDGVACGTKRACAAVGYGDDPTGRETVALTSH